MKDLVEEILTLMNNRAPSDGKLTSTIENDGIHTSKKHRSSSKTDSVGKLHAVPKADSNKHKTEGHKSSKYISGRSSTGSPRAQTVYHGFKVYTLNTTIEDYDMLIYQFYYSYHLIDNPQMVKVQLLVFRKGFLYIIIIIIFDARATQQILK